MIQIGLVGAGGMGAVHYANYRELKNCRVAALVGVSEKDREHAAQWQLPLYDSIAHMLEAQPEIGVVDITTPTFLHYGMVMEALQYKRDVITEKPIALSLANAREMLDEADRQGCLLFVGQVLQFTKEVQILRGLVASEEYGKPLDACFERLSACPRWAQGGWLFDKARSGLLPYDLHIHDLDVIVSLFGKPSSYRFTSCKGADKSYPEQYRFVYDYDSLHVNAEAAWFNADIPWTARWRVYFERAMLVNDGKTLTAYQFDAPPKVFDTADEVTVSTGINVPPCGWYYNELKHFLSCMEARTPSPLVPREQLLTVMDILEDISRQS